jgi:predicted enzyme related to lactoylglutathione lyase
VYAAARDYSGPRAIRGEKRGDNMPEPTMGRFAWHELHTTDRARALAFYSQLAGWEVKEVPMGPGELYGLCLMNGRDIAGVMKSKAAPHVPPHWLPYIAVEDVDATAAKVDELRGKILSQPMDIPDVGRFAVAKDPQGAAFALYKHAKPYEPEPAVPPPGAFCWDELSTSDPEAAEKFYKALFGYSVEASDMGPAGTYRILKRGDRQTGGIMKMPPAVPQPHWLAYLAVKDVDASTRRAKELGATIHAPPADIPKVGRFSVIADPTGASIALFTGAPQ